MWLWVWVMKKQVPIAVHKKKQTKLSTVKSGRYQIASAVSTSKVPKYWSVFWKSLNRYRYLFGEKKKSATISQHKKIRFCLRTWEMITSWSLLSLSRFFLLWTSFRWSRRSKHLTRVKTRISFPIHLPQHICLRQNTTSSLRVDLASTQRIDISCCCLQSFPLVLHSIFARDFLS